MADSTEKTYEMLWDCEYCGTRKLLGKTHRHCPECGAVQNADKRYFPEDDEKVAVEDHEFVGADINCASCGAPNSARAKYCTECGGVVAEGVEVKGVTDAGATSTGERAAAKTKSKKRLALFAMVGFIVIVGVVCVFVFWKKEVTLTATGHSWQREIFVERFQSVTETKWCDQMPRDAYRVTRTREVRSHKKIPDGETCTTKRVDNKDGTFSVKRSCTPKYRKEPVYDNRCRYSVDRWREIRSVKTGGAAISDQLAWPTLTLPKNPAAVLGAERTGRHVATYKVYFFDKGETHTCEFPEAKWRTFGVNTKWQGESAVLTGILDCASLKPGG
jgi:hypothetical protein